MEISVFVRSTIAIVSLVATAACTGSSPMSPSAAPTASLSSSSAATDAQNGSLTGNGSLVLDFNIPGYPGAGGFKSGVLAGQTGRVVELAGDIKGLNFEAGVCQGGTLALPNDTPDPSDDFVTHCLVFGEGAGQFTRLAPGGVAFTTCTCGVKKADGTYAYGTVILKISYPPAVNNLYPGGFTKFTFQGGTGDLANLSGQGTLNFANQGSEISFTYRFNRS